MTHVQRLRKERKWSVEVLAFHAGVGISTARRADKGGDIRLSTARKIAKALGADPAIFFDPHGSKTNRAS